MSLKAVELQIAIPKTFDAGKMQEQITQQIHASQEQANDALKQQLEKNHTLLLESSEVKNLRQDEPKEQTDDEHSEHHKMQGKEQDQKKQAKHPFKGNLFDFSG
ncbi:MAG: RNA polymerase subunit sigma [Kurthia sp.]|nr:RNA polymerase subunit sigma [Candidatus Kurthia equi]